MLIAGAKEFLFPHMGEIGENYSKQLRDLLRLVTSQRRQITKYGKDTMLKLADPSPDVVDQPVADRPLESDQTAPRPSWQEFTAMAKAANEGNEEARAKLRKVLDTYPDIWCSAGNLD